MRRDSTLQKIKDAEDRTINLLVSHWDFSVEIHTKPYAYEAFIGINDFIKKSNLNEPCTYLNHPSRLVRNIAQDIENLGEASFHLFKSMWDNQLVATPGKTAFDR